MSEKEQKAIAIVKKVLKWTIIIAVVLFLTFPKWLPPLEKYIEESSFSRKNYKEAKEITENMSFDTEHSYTDREMYEQLYNLGNYCCEKKKKNVPRAWDAYGWEWQKGITQAKANVEIIREFEKEHVHKIIEDSNDTEELTREQKEEFLKKYDSYLTDEVYGYFCTVCECSYGASNLTRVLDTMGDDGNIARNMIDEFCPDAIAASRERQKEEWRQAVKEQNERVYENAQAKKQKEEEEKNAKKNSYSIKSGTFEYIDDFDDFDDADDWASDAVEAGIWEEYDDAMDYWEDYH